MLSFGLAPLCGSGAHRLFQHPPISHKRRPSRRAPHPVPAKPTEQAAAPKVPCTRAIVSRTRPPSTRSSRLRRQRASSDTSSHRRYLRRTDGSGERGPGPPPGRVEGAAYLCLNRTMASAPDAAGRRDWARQAERPANLHAPPPSRGGCKSACVRLGRTRGFALKSGVSLYFPNVGRPTFEASPALKARECRGNWGL